MTALTVKEMLMDNTIAWRWMRWPTIRAHV